jgi:hypothetical protein
MSGGNASDGLFDSRHGAYILGQLRDGGIRIRHLLHLGGHILCQKLAVSRFSCLHGKEARSSGTRRLNDRFIWAVRSRDFRSISGRASNIRVLAVSGAFKLILPGEVTERMEKEGSVVWRELKDVAELLETPRIEATGIAHTPFLSPHELINPRTNCDPLLHPSVALRAELKPGLPRYPRLEQ